mmetsp:Transcript_11250/g.28778  ORF Transcript_11250/g.28778 Transcript_11250/m.28778 type:complete len:202 (+) Transcript_11250:178-783(+)
MVVKCPTVRTGSGTPAAEIAGDPVKLEGLTVSIGMAAYTGVCAGCPVDWAAVSICRVPRCHTTPVKARASPTMSEAAYCPLVFSNAVAAISVIFTTAVWLPGVEPSCATKKTSCPVDSSSSRKKAWCTAGMGAPSDECTRKETSRVSVGAMAIGASMASGGRPSSTGACKGLPPDAIAVKTASTTARDDVATVTSNVPPSE